METTWVNSAHARQYKAFCVQLFKEHRSGIGNGIVVWDTYHRQKHVESWRLNANG